MQPKTADRVHGPTEHILELCSLRIPRPAFLNSIKLVDRRISRLEKWEMFGRVLGNAARMRMLACPPRTNL